VQAGVWYPGAVESERSVDARRRYAAAPCLPTTLDGDLVDLRTLVAAPCGIVEIEVGPGRGGFMFERLAARPDVQLVAFEVKRKWATLVNDKLARLGLRERGVVFADDAKEALARLGPDAAVAAVYLHFPDPWWKKKHHRRLVVGATLLDEVARLLVPGGELFVQTDVEERADQYDAQIRVHGAFVAKGDAPGSASVAENPYEARSHRERRAISDELPIHRLRFARAPNS
jgi:tRNA (guanine-N7-)-methyltransferase